MSIEESKLWKCDYCEASENQTGARAAAMPPTPPMNWYLVDVCLLIPKRVVEGQKRDEERGNIRKVVCPECSRRLVPILKNEDEGK